MYNDIWYFDLDTHVWHQIAAVGYIPVPRESCAAALVDDTIYIFGGRGLNGSGLGDLCAYRIQSKSESFNKLTMYKLIIYIKKAKDGTHLKIWAHLHLLDMD